MNNENIIPISNDIGSRPQTFETFDSCNKYPDKARPEDLNNFFARAIPEGYTRKNANALRKDGVNTMRI